jgi:hypothetical protein
MYTSNINSSSLQLHFPKFMAANIYTWTKAYLGLHTHKPKTEYSTLVYMCVGNSDTCLPLIINLTVQHKWVKFCLAYVGWQQKHDLVTV